MYTVIIVKRGGIMKKTKWMGILLAGIMTVSAGAATNIATKYEVAEPVSIVSTIEAKAVDVRRGGFNGNNWSGKTAVYATSYWSWGKLKYRNPKIKVCAFNANGKIKSGKFTVEVTTPQDRNFRKTMNITGSGTWTLNYGYQSYNVRIKRNNPWYNTSKNVAACYWWSIDAKSNCYF